MVKEGQYKFFYNREPKTFDLKNNTKCKTIFVHIPRTGGTSIASALGKDIIDFGHNKLISLKDIDDYFTFCFVRDPYDRFMSDYCYYKSKIRLDEGITREIKKYEDFEDFALNFHKNECVINYIHFHTQKSYVYDVDIRLVDFIGRYESLQRDFNELCSIIGVRETTLNHLNKSLYDKQLYTSDMKENIYQHYIEDFETFNYDK